MMADRKHWVSRAFITAEAKRMLNLAHELRRRNIHTEANECRESARALYDLICDWDEKHRTAPKT